MNWSVFAEVIVWAVMVAAFIIACGALVVASEPMTDREARNSVKTLIVSVIIGVICVATLAGMYAA
jgi:hypothetical protein